MIYLDIDGVLILQGDRPDADCVKQRAALVRDLCRTMNVDIVVSSQRRISNDVIDLLTGLGLAGYMTKSCPNRTPFIRGDDLDPDLPVRGQEIDAHIKANGIVRHVVIDDDSTLSDHNYVRIDPAMGLTGADVMKAAALLA